MKKLIVFLSLALSVSVAHAQNSEQFVKVKCVNITNPQADMEGPDLIYLKTVDGNVFLDILSAPDASKKNVDFFDSYKKLVAPTLLALDGNNTVTNPDWEIWYRDDGSPGIKFDNKKMVTLKLVTNTANKTVAMETNSSGSTIQCESIE